MSWSVAQALTGLGANRRPRPALPIRLGDYADKIRAFSHGHQARDGELGGSHEDRFSCAHPIMHPVRLSNLREGKGLY